VPGKETHPKAQPQHKPQRKAIDVPARLADRVEAIELSGTPLVGVMGLLSQMSTLRFSYDLDAVAQRGVRLTDPVSLRLEGASIEEILKSVLSGRGLTHLTVNDYLLITTPEAHRTALRKVRYRVADLARDPAQMDALAATIQRLLAPESWRLAGGPGIIEAADDALVVTQTELVHRQVLSFCEKLRTARGIPLRSREDPQQFTLATRLDRARARLAQPVTVNLDAVPLERIADDLGALSSTVIVIDWLALDAEHIGPEVRGTLKVENRPLGDALGELLAPLGLVFRVVGADTLEITTRRALAARLELEFYPAADLVPRAMTLSSLVERIKSATGGSSWNDAGGPAVLHADEPSRCLIVLQSQPVHSAVHSLLADLRAKSAPAAAKGE